MTAGRFSLSHLSSRAATGRNLNLASVGGQHDRSRISTPLWNHSNRLDTVAIVPYQAGPLVTSSVDNGVIFVPSPQQFFTSNLKDAVQALHDLRRLSGRRAQFLQTASKLYTETVSKANRQQLTLVPKSSQKQHTTLADIPAEATGTLIPHDRFRALLRSSTDGKVIRKILRLQLLSCKRISELFRVIAVALQVKKAVHNLAMLDLPIARAIYRCRTTSADTALLRALNAILSRFRQADMHISPRLVFLSAKFAARSRSLPAMQKALREIREGGLGMSSDTFRAIIAKCSIGYRGLGEIRNGRWRRSELLQVLTGFDDCKHLPRDQQYHLETFLERHDWYFLHGYIAALARCRDTESIRQEWEIWMSSASRREPRLLTTLHDDKLPEYRRSGPRIDTKARGDEWFIEQGVYSGDLKLAWLMLSRSEVQFCNLKAVIRYGLLDGFQFCPKSLWSPTMREDLITKYDRELEAIESALGVKWVSHEGSSTSEGTQPCDGHHEVVEELEAALERLASPEFRAQPDFGYPWESEPLLPASERTTESSDDADTKDHDRCLG